MEVRDYIFTGILVVNVFALGATLWSIRRQSKATDAKNYFYIKEKIANAWKEYRISKESEGNFNFSEILSLLEGVCHLYNKCIFYGATKEQIRDYMVEVIPEVCENAKEQLTNSISGPETHSEMEKFAKAEGLQSAVKILREARQSGQSKTNE